MARKTEIFGEERPAAAMHRIEEVNSKPFNISFLTIFYLLEAIIAILTQ